MNINFNSFMAVFSKKKFSTEGSNIPLTLTLSHKGRGNKSRVNINFLAFKDGGVPISVEIRSLPDNHYQL